MVWTSPSTLPTANVGVPYSYQLQASGDYPATSYSIVSGDLLGLTLSSTGLISGTPKFRATTSFTIRAAGISVVGAPQITDKTFTLAVTTGALSELHIQRLQIYFDNNRAEITVDKNDMPPRLFARLDYVGSGLLRGYWEVDGRVHSHVQQTLVYGTNLILEAAPVPPLPTYAGGSHRVRLVITEPVQAITLPVAIYYVAESPEKVFLPIGLFIPADRQVLADNQTPFSWEMQSKAAAYLVEFFDHQEGRPIFSAYTRKAQYSLADHVWGRVFADKRRYFWRVTGFAADNQVINQSRLQVFHVQESAAGRGPNEQEVR
jgi:hypothetical protein